MFSFNKLALMLVSFAAAVFVLYGQFTRNPIVFDDLPFFMVDAASEQPVSAFQFELLQLRSLPYATLAWTKAAFGLDLIYFRLGNLLLHVATVWTLFFLLTALFETVSDPEATDTLPPRWLAIFASLIFAVHPVATYAVGYLVQRTILMATLFSLLALLVYVRGSLRRQPVWIWLCVPFYYLAVFSKEHAIMLPAVLVAITPLLHADWRSKLTQRWPVFVALAVVAGVVLLAKKGMMGSIYELNGAEMLGQDNLALAYPLSVLTQSWLFFKYAFLWALPNPAWMSIDMREPFAPGLWSMYALAAIGFLAWGAVATWLLLKRGRKGLVGFGLLFPWLLFMTEFSTVRIQEVFVLYRSYLWAPGALCLLPVVMGKLNLRMASVTVAAVGALLFGLSMERLMTLSHPVLVWDDAEKLVKGRTDLPGAYRIYYNRGTELIKIDQPDHAIADLKQSVALSRDFAEAHGNLGAAYMKKQDWTQAQASLTKAIEIAQEGGKSPSPRYVYGRAQAFENLGELEKSQADYRLSCQLAKLGCDKVSG
ncbi:MAG: hypothetical protein RJA34_2764 [Pseudomonadota bacterium]|jgi:hypothetical protein